MSEQSPEPLGHPWRDTEADQAPKAEPSPEKMHPPAKDSEPPADVPSLSDMADNLIDQIRGDRKRRTQWRRQH